MKLEKLNLVMSYPVNWSVFMVMRDYIQNFYDAVGWERFGTSFAYDYNRETKKLEMCANRDFSMDWLTYIGASSKRAELSGRQIGRFGEGFKIASLVALRDFGWDIVMRSRNWKIHVTEAEDMIDGVQVKVLAYETEETEFFPGAVLMLGNVNGDQAAVFDEALGDFYYKENPNFGEIIAEREDYAIYYPQKGGKFEKDGALYAGRLRRAPLSAPLIICSHTYRPDRDGRERDEFRNRQVRECVSEVIAKISPDTAGKILRTIENSWSRAGGKSKFFFQWGDMVPDLIWRMFQSKREVECFKQEYGERVIADFPTERYGNRRKLALVWLHKNEKFRNRRLVFHTFQWLGIDELEQLCEENGGYERVRTANEREQKYLAILKSIALDIFRDYICYDELPECRVITSSAINEGSACVHKISGGKKNFLGLKADYEIRTVQLKVELFAKGQFAEAVAVYMHELLHQFGGDGSKNFRRAIGAMALQMLKEAERLAEYQKKWEAVEKGV